LRRLVGSVVPGQEIEIAPLHPRAGTQNTIVAECPAGETTEHLSHPIRHPT
jgi:hypothetical protein